MKYLALLRGINVGGNNIIPMRELNDCFHEMGFGKIQTYIQSGNVVFESRLRSVKKVTSTIETALSRRFSYDAQAFVISANGYADQLKCTHPGFGKDESRKHNAMFILGNTRPAEILEQLPSPASELEDISWGSRVIFWSADRNSIARTTMMLLSKSRWYKSLTVRNHKTTFRLAELLE